MTQVKAMKESVMLELAARCEAATGPNRELDFAIIKAVGWSKDRPYNREDDGWREPVLFTASLDAAITLVPESAHCGMRQDGGPEGKGWAWVRCKVGDQWQEFSCEPRFVANMTLALCAAALKARATLLGAINAPN